MYVYYKRWNTVNIIHTLTPIYFRQSFFTPYSECLMKPCHFSFVHCWSVFRQRSITLSLESSWDKMCVIIFLAVSPCQFDWIILAIIRWKSQHVVAFWFQSFINWILCVIFASQMWFYQLPQLFFGERRLNKCMLWSFSHCCKVFLRWCRRLFDFHWMVRSIFHSNYTFCSESARWE